MRKQPVQKFNIHSQSAAGVKWDPRRPPPVIKDTWAPGGCPAVLRVRSGHFLLTWAAEGPLLKLLLSLTPQQSNKARGSRVW